MGDSGGASVIKSPDQNVLIDWSYTTRKNKMKLKCDPDQTYITEYFPFLDKVNKIFQENQLSALATSSTSKSESVRYSTSLFQSLLSNALNNVNQVPKRRRHSEVMKKFAISLLFTAGSLAYELVHKNMPEAFPSLRTVQKEVNKKYCSMVEGEFQFDMLSDHLDAYNAPRVISISEDGTRVLSRIEYDEESDKFIGFVLPVNDKYIPVNDSFCGCASFEDIERIFSTSVKASFAYVYMAQSLSPTVPPFCLALIGTDNHFDTRAVLSRWNYMIKECSARNIHIISFGSDGDSRLLSAMRLSSKLYSYSLSSYSDLITCTTTSTCKPLPITFPPTWNSWFAVERLSNISPVQDVVHLAVKLKARLLTYSQLLPLGKYSAESSHLSMLQASFRKEQHNLRVKDLDHKDRQNFEAAVRISSTNVLLLLDELKDAKGTKYYLQVLKSIMDSYLDKELSPLKRIEEAWFSLFFVRYWRQWLLSHEKYTLENNFITLNAYICIEINAHALITLLVVLRDMFPSLSTTCYLPWLLGSQPCERAFRAARSMSTVFSTVINFGILGLLRRLQRIQIQIVLQSQSPVTGIIYPQLEVHKKKDGINKENIHSVSDITNEEIEAAVKAGFNRARSVMEDLGMKDLLVITGQWEIAFGDVDYVIGNDGDEEEMVEFDEEFEDRDVSLIGKMPLEESSQIDDIQVCDQEKKCDDLEDLEMLEKKKIIDEGIKEKLVAIHSDGTLPMYKLHVDAGKEGKGENSHCEKSLVKRTRKYVEVHHNGESIFVKKSTLAWLFQEGERVSSDRLFRVRNIQPYSTSVQRIPSKIVDTNADLHVPIVQESVMLGSICAFIDPSGTAGWSLGRILQFSHYQKKLKRDRQFKKSDAPITSSVGILCTWFRHPAPDEDNCKFVMVHEESYNYIPLCESYICTLTMGCFQQIKGTAISSSSIGPIPEITAVHTAQEFIVHQDVIKFISTALQSKVGNNTNAVVLVNPTSPAVSAASMHIKHSSDKSIVESTSKKWIDYAGLSLSLKDKHLIENGKELTDMHINCACALLSRQFPNSNGLQSTLFQ